MGAWTIYYPSYLMEGKIKAINAVISLGSAIILIPLMPSFWPCLTCKMLWIKLLN
jgi:hypothetical protein